MQRLLYIIQKEFIQLFRNKTILPLITVTPILQLILLSYAANSEVKNVQLTIVDQDRSTYSRRLIEKIRVADRFVLSDLTSSLQPADAAMQRGETDIILTIPPGFERDFLRYKSTDLQLLVDAINGTQATVGAGYLATIIAAFNTELRSDAAPQLVAAARGGPTFKLQAFYGSGPSGGVGDYSCHAAYGHEYCAGARNGYHRTT